jgi:hypothetical protein
MTSPYTPYLQLVGHTFLAVHSADRSAAVKNVLADRGFGVDQLGAGERLAEEAVELFDRRAEEVVDERITHHEVHAHAGEVDMWMQTAEFRLEDAVEDAQLLAKVLGYDIHCDEHIIEVVARALRMLGMIRTDETIHEKLGTGRSVKDLLIRGHTMLRKLVDTCEKYLSPSHAGDPEAAVFDDLDASHDALTEWLHELDEGVDALEDRPDILGEIGYVPDDVGLPLGGTGYSITLHERSHREPPAPGSEEGRDPSWTIGRQGRNNENMGKGWVE